VTARGGAAGRARAAALSIVLAGCAERGGGADAQAGAAPRAERDASPAPWFVEEARARGLDFVHDSGQEGERLLFPEIACGGAALFDMDGDGDLDAYLVQAGSLTAPPAQRPPNRLYRNRGDGTFDDVTAGSGAGDRGYGMGAATGDCDGDGDLDLYVTNVGRNALLRNDGSGRFTDVTEASGTGHEGWGASSAFFDADGDGDLDLFVVNYLHWSPETERECFASTGERDYCAPISYQAPAESVLYRNEGDGTFTDASAAAGLRTALGNGLGVVCADLDGDGRTDVYVANDGTRNHMWKNRGDGTFREDALAAGTALDREGIAKAGMGVCAEDVDDDGDADLLVVNLAGEGDSLYRNGGDGAFTDDTVRTGLSAATRMHTRFGAGLHDFDHDGVLDLYAATGRVRRGAPLYGADPFAEPELLLRGVAPGRFEIVPNGGTAAPMAATSRAAAFGDVDGDGDVDVLVVNRDGPAHLFMNVAPKRGHWITLDVVDRAGAPAIGARVAIELASGRRITREVRTASSYLAANDPRLHVGLGDAQRVERVTVRWPDGAVEEFGTFTADRQWTVRRGDRGSPPRGARNPRGEGRLEGR
jgi:hypothetical protein